MSNTSTEKEKEQKTSIPRTNNAGCLNMGLSYAFGPFPDEPLLSALDKTLLLSSRFRKHSNFDEKVTYKKLINTSIGTECCIQNSGKCTKSCPDLTALIEPHRESIAEKIRYSSRSSSENEVLKKIDKIDTDDKGKMWTVQNITDNGIKTYEIWAEEVSKTAPSMVFILPPKGDVVSFEYVNRE